MVDLVNIIKENISFMVISFNIIKENISFMKTGFLIAFLCIAYLLAIPTFAYIGPVAYQTEQVYAHYHTNGTLDSSQNYSECSDNSNPCRFGFIEVALPNQNDTLQTIKVNLTGTTGTNLDDEQAYRATASSSSALWARTNLYFNTSGSGGWNDPSYYYKITNTNLAPAIQLSLGYSNAQGGYDIYDDDNIGSGLSVNTMNYILNITNPSTTKTLNNVEVILQFDLDTGVGSTRDILNITSVTNSSGTTTLSDTGGDGDNDKLSWTGTLGTNATVQVNFTATIEDTVNFDAGDTGINLINLDSNLSDKGATSAYTEDSSLSTLTIDYKYSRGPIRQGIDMAEASGGGSWNIRGFVRVLAKNDSEVGSGTALNYNITEWAIYNASAYNISASDRLQSGHYTPSIFNAS